MTTPAEDRSDWLRDGQSIRRTELLRLIEENGGPQELDLRGTALLGDGTSDEPWENPIDLSRETIQRERDTYRHTNGADPPWVTLRETQGINLQEAQLQEANLEGAYLAQAQLQRAGLREAHLGGAHLQRAELNWARLERAHLNSAELQSADLGGAQLQEAHLSEAYLQGANLSGAQLQGAYLQTAQLQEAYLEGAHLQRAELNWARLEGAHLSSAELQRTDLRDAQLQGADLRRAQLQGTQLSRAQLQGADLREAQLQGVDFYGVESLAGAFWYGAFLDRTRIRSDQLGKAIGDEMLEMLAKGEIAKERPVTRAARSLSRAELYRYASESYLLLKNNFGSIGRYEDVAWAYIKEQQMEKMAYHWQWRNNGWRIWRARGPLWRWARNWAYELLTGYGERVHMPVVWAVVVVLLFALIYAAPGNIAAGAVGALEGQPTHSPVTALIHSISAFATIGFNTLEPQGSVARLLTAIEAMLGIGLFALFVFTLGNRMSRS